MAQSIFLAGSAPSTPGAGYVSLYAKTDKLFYAMDDAGNENVLSATISAYSTSGLIVNPNTGTPASQIDISAGNIVDSTGAYLFQGTAMTKDLSLTWAAGTGNGGYYTSGGLPISSTIHVFAIRKDSDGSIDYYADTSVSAANIPTGYTAYRRIHSFRTDGSGNIVLYTATEISGGGVKTTPSVPTGDYSGAGSIPSRAALVLSVPLGIQVEATLFLIRTGSTGGFLLVTESTQADSTPSATTGDVYSDSGVSLGCTEVNRITDTSGRVYHRQSAAATVYIATKSWVDWRN
jgi:hypothetical protein